MLLSSLLEQLSSNANPHWNAQLGLSESHSDEKLISEEQCRKHNAGWYSSANYFVPSVLHLLPSKKPCDRVVIKTTLRLLLKMAEKVAAEHEQQDHQVVKEQQQLHAI